MDLALVRRALRLFPALVLVASPSASLSCSSSQSTTAVGNGPGARPPYAWSSAITGISFDWSTHDERAEGSDNWPVTWSDDGHQYTSWGDGGGFGGTNSDGRVSLGVARVEGSWDTYSGFNVWGGKNPQNPPQFDGKSYGILSDGGVLYMWWGPGSDTTVYAQTRMAISTDRGATWTRSEWDFTDVDPTLVVPTLLNFGQDYAGARDTYVYSYFIRKETTGSGLGIHRGGSPATGKIDLARVRQGQMMDQSAYEFFAGFDAGGDPVWTSDASQRQPVFEDANGVGWTVSVSHNAPLARYLLITEHGESFKGHLGMFDAPEPWGPWTTVEYYEGAEYFGSNVSHTDTTFFWNFANKWLSSDGKSFTLVFTGIRQDDSWNSIRGSFSTRPREALACTDVKKLKARCVKGDSIRTVLRLRRKAPPEATVRFRIDGQLHRASVTGKRARLVTCCYGPGGHTVRLRRPAHCLEPVHVQCSPRAG